MSLLNQLSPVKTKSKRRLGRGYGMKKGGHTSGRGQKGQKSRSKVPIWFEGGQLPLIRRTPFLKGKARFKPLKPKPVTISLEALDKFSAKASITEESISKTLGIPLKTIKQRGIKVLNRGKLTKALTVKVPTSQSAAVAIEKIGGSVER